MKPRSIADDVALHYSRKMLVRIVWVLALVLAAPLGRAHATTMLMASMDTLATTAEVVVVATSVGSGIVVENGRVLTEHTVEVDEVWAGPVAAGQTLAVRTLGGVVGPVAQHVHGAASLGENQSAVLFLRRRNAQSPFYVVAMWQGVFFLEQLTSTTRVHRARTEARIVGALTVGTPFPEDLPSLRQAVEEARAP